MLYKSVVVNVFRAAAFVVCALFIWVVPGYSELSAAPSRHAVRWKMFSGIALDLFEVTFETLDADGNRVPVDRFSLLGYAEPERAPRSVRTLKTQNEVWVLAKRLCTQLGPKAALFARVRDATRRGWKTLEDGSIDFCAARSWPAKEVVPVRSEPGGDS